MRYELRTYGWFKGRPFNILLAEADSLEFFNKIIHRKNRDDLYVVDRKTNIVIENWYRPEKAQEVAA